MKKQLIIVLSLLLLSCANEDEEKATKEITFSKEIIEAIKLAKEYKPLISDSTFKLKDESGEEYIFKRREGLLDSVFTVLYSSGKLKMMLNYEKGQLVFGQQGLYYDDALDYAFFTEEDTFIMEGHPMYKTYYYSNHQGNLNYVREYDSIGDPTNSKGDLIAFSRYSTDQDSAYFQFYLVRQPYNPPRYYDLQRSFFLTISDSDIVNKELPINEEYSVVFYNASLSDLKNKSLMGQTRFSDYVYGFDTVYYSTDSVIYEF